MAETVRSLAIEAAVETAGERPRLGWRDRVLTFALLLQAWNLFSSLADWYAALDEYAITGYLLKIGVVLLMAD